MNGRFTVAHEATWQEADAYEGHIVKVNGTDERLKVLMGIPNVNRDDERDYGVIRLITVRVDEQGETTDHTWIITDSDHVTMVRDPEYLP